MKLSGAVDKSLRTNLSEETKKDVETARKELKEGKGLNTKKLVAELDL
jgi:hypothetical protein